MSICWRYIFSVYFYTNFYFSLFLFSVHVFSFVSGWRLLTDRDVFFSIAQYICIWINAIVPIICNEFVLLSNWMCNYVSCTALSQYGHYTHTLTIAVNDPENQQIINSIAAYKIKSEHCKKCCMHSRFWIFDVLSASFFCVHNAHSCTHNEWKISFFLLSRFWLGFSSITEFHTII